MRLVITRVFPDPAPARISSGPSSVQDRLALFGIQCVEEVMQQEVGAGRRVQLATSSRCP